jgi:hypothetical protein
MTRVRVFQTLVVISALLYIAWIGLPHLSRTFSPDVQKVLALGGYGGASWVTDPRFFLSVGIGKLLSSLGLFLFLSWGRWLLLAVVAVSLASAPFAGVSTGVPLDNIVGYLLCLTDGAILALAFFSPFAEAMHKEA